MPATLPLPTDKVKIHRMVEEVGYPVMLKASREALGKGMQVIENAYELDEGGILEGVNQQQRLIMMKSIWKS
jgi:biotin carboxylase